MLGHQHDDSDPAAVFSDIYRRRAWGEEGSVSGLGSSLEHTAAVRAALPELLERLGVETLLDAACGDFHWLRGVALPGVRYLGIDVVAEIAAENQERYGSPSREFRRLDFTREPLAAVDLILCRDALVHLSDRRVHAALQNFAASGARYLLTTTFPEHDRNRDVATGGWRPLNLERPPFDLPEPLELIREGRVGPAERFPEKCLGLWRL